MKNRNLLVSLHGLLLRYASNGLQQSNPCGIWRRCIQYGGRHRKKVLTFAIERKPHPCPPST